MADVDLYSLLSDQQAKHAITTLDYFKAALSGNAFLPPDIVGSTAVLQKCSIWLQATSIGLPTAFIWSQQFPVEIYRFGIMKIGTTLWDKPVGTYADDPANSPPIPLNSGPISDGCPLMTRVVLNSDYGVIMQPSEQIVMQPLPQAFYTSGRGIAGTVKIDSSSVAIGETALSGYASYGYVTDMAQNMSLSPPAIVRGSRDGWGATNIPVNAGVMMTYYGGMANGIDSMGAFASTNVPSHLDSQSAIFFAVNKGRSITQSTVWTMESISGTHDTYEALTATGTSFNTPPVSQIQNQAIAQVYPTPNNCMWLSAWANMGIYNANSPNAAPVFQNGVTVAVPPCSPLDVGGVRMRVRLPNIAALLRQNIVSQVSIGSSGQYQYGLALSGGPHYAEAEMLRAMVFSNANPAVEGYTTLPANIETQIGASGDKFVTPNGLFTLGDILGGSTPASCVCVGEIEVRHVYIQATSVPSTQTTSSEYTPIFTFRIQKKKLFAVDEAHNNGLLNTLTTQAVSTTFPAAYPPLVIKPTHVIVGYEFLADRVPGFQYIGTFVMLNQVSYYGTHRRLVWNPLGTSPNGNFVDMTTLFNAGANSNGAVPMDPTRLFNLWAPEIIEVDYVIQNFFQAGMAGPYEVVRLDGLTAGQSINIGGTLHVLGEPNALTMNVKDDNAKLHRSTTTVQARDLLRTLVNSPKIGLRPCMEIADFEEHRQRIHGAKSIEDLLGSLTVRDPGIALDAASFLGRIGRGLASLIPTSSPFLGMLKQGIEKGIDFAEDVGALDAAEQWGGEQLRSFGARGRVPPPPPRQLLPPPPPPPPPQRAVPQYTYHPQDYSDGDEWDDEEDVEEL